MCECFDQAGLPVRFETSSHRLIRRPEHGAVTDRQPQQPSQRRLGAIEFRQCGFRLRPGLVITITGQGFIGVGETFLATAVQNHLGIAPRLLGAVARHHRSIPLAVGQVEVPVLVLNILHQVDGRLLKLTQRQIVIDPGDHHPLADSTESTELLGDRTGNLGELGSRSSEQWLAVPEIDVAGVSRVVEIETTGNVAAEVGPVVSDRKTGSVSHLLAEHRREIAHFSDQRPAAANTARHERVVLRCLVATPDHRGRELGIKRRQGRCHATATKQHARFLDGRIPDRCDAIG